MLRFSFFKRKEPLSHSGDGAIVYRFPEPTDPHLATVKDRVRPSGLTSVRFIEEKMLVAADFGSKKTYLVDISSGVMSILDTHDTIISDGTPVETDLIDYRDGEFMVSNFYQGTFSRYEIRNSRIRFLREVQTSGPTNMHGLRYIPGHPRLVWLTFCNNKRPCHAIADIETGELLHYFDTDQQCQDIAFIGGHAVVFARTDHISKGEKIPAFGSRKNIMFATAYVYRLPEDLVKEPPVMFSRWKGEGHLDASKESADGRIFCANQYLDRIDIFSLSREGILSLTGMINGFQMPHGLDILGNRLAITNYGDQTLRLMSLPS
jgi:hypothetical protein